jgi:hypothetical protein
MTEYYRVLLEGPNGSEYFETTLSADTTGATGPTGAVVVTGKAAQIDPPL